LEAVVLRELLERPYDEFPAVFHRAAVIYPGEPSPEMIPVAIGQLGELFGMPFLQ
jgi:hypothetical protein